MNDLKTLFNPKTIAVVGATDKEHSVGRSILRNLLLSEDRQVFAVNPHRESVMGLPCYGRVKDIPRAVDLAVIAVPREIVVEAIEDCGLAGAGGVIIVSSGFGEGGSEGKRQEGEIAALRDKYGMRIIGPNSVGIIRPTIGLNTTPIEDMPDKGNIAFITESAAFGRALMEWGVAARIGFSMIASLGSMIDVGFGDLIDFLGEDPSTRSIMIYMEHGMGDIKRFASAAKGFSRNKPIIVLRPLPADEEDETARSLTGSMAGHNRMYDALFKRIGVVRVREAADIFNVAGVLHSRRLPKGPRLLIITNAGGVGTMATNTLTDLGGVLASLSDASLTQFDNFLPPHWNRQNPIYLLRDADAGRFDRAIGIGLEDPGVDGILIIYTYQAAASSEEFARVVSERAGQSQKPILTACMGGLEARKGKELLLRHNIPDYDTPEEAVKTYVYMYRYERNLELLYETPSELSVDRAPPTNNLRVAVKSALGEGKTFLGGEEAARFLTNYGIPAIRSYMTSGVEEAVEKARRIGYPVVLKVISPDIFDRADVGGLAIGVADEEELRSEFGRMMTRIRGEAPSVHIAGIAVQKMMENIDYHLILGAKKDPKFGTVILFGMGGVGVQVFRDFSVGLPPLNQTLARRLMEETKVYRMLQGYRGKPPADFRQLEQMIVVFSNLIVDFPEIPEMDVNPIAVTDGRPSPLDARIILKAEAAPSVPLSPPRHHPLSDAIRDAWRCRTAQR